MLIKKKSLGPDSSFFANPIFDIFIIYKYDKFVNVINLELNSFVIVSMIHKFKFKSCIIELYVFINNFDFIMVFVEFEEILLIKIHRLKAE